jgi:hypothetical protein
MVEVLGAISDLENKRLATSCDTARIFQLDRNGSRILQQLGLSGPPAAADYLLVKNFIIPPCFALAYYTAPA